jgi:CRISPR/Cas system endoribonuclease Cas6 (RAMP superfamily)
LDYRGLVARAQKIETKKVNLNWHDWRRYSNRQDQAMLMGGMTGSLTYAGKLSEFLPLLEYVEKVHIGKATTFGLGKIQIIPEEI